jgi:hypothetical protein
MSKGAGLVRAKKEKKGGTHSERGLGGKTTVTERRKKCKKEKWHRFAMCRKLKGVGSNLESFRTCGAR